MVIFVKVLRCKNEQINKILKIYINNLNFEVEIFFFQMQSSMWAEEKNGEYLLHTKF